MDDFCYVKSICENLNSLDGSSVFHFEECEDGSLVISSTEIQILHLYNLIMFMCNKYIFSLSVKDSVTVINCRIVLKK